MQALSPKVDPDWVRNKIGIDIKVKRKLCDAVPI